MYEWNFAYLWQYRQLFVNGLVVTVGYSLLCIALGLAVGLVAGMGGLAKTRLIHLPLKWYVELFRATPVLVLIIWFYYALPVLIGVAMTASVAAVLALSLYGGAFYAEIIRGGIVSIEPGQTDAARALGMTRFQVMRRVVLPQALRRMTPPLMNQSIMQLKNTSLLSVLALPDLVYQGQAVAHETYRPLEAYTLIALMYIAILLPASKMVRRMESKRAGQQ